MTGSLNGLFWAWKRAYKTSNWIDLPKGNDRPTPVDPKTNGFLISFSKDTPACPYKNGMIPIEPKNG